MQYAAIVCITIAIASASVGALNINTATIKREFYDQFDLHFNNATSDIQLVLARINDPAVVLDDLPFANEVYPMCLPFPKEPGSIPNLHPSHPHA